MGRIYTKLGGIGKVDKRMLRSDVFQLHSAAGSGAHFHGAFMQLFTFVPHSGILFSILALVLMITVHELGHFVTARAAGIRIFEFSLGFGPTVFKRVDRWGVMWSVRLLPLGGFVHMHRRDPDFGGAKGDGRVKDGEYFIFTWLRTKVSYKDGEPVDDGTVEEKSERLYHPTNVDPHGRPIHSVALEDVSFAWQAVVLMAGIGMNILFAALCFSASLMIGFDALVSRDVSFDVFDDDTTSISISHEKLLELSRDHRVVVSALDTEEIGASMGIRTGDVIVAIDGVHVLSPEEAESALEPWWRGESFDITLDRKGDVFTLSYLPEYIDEDRPAEESGGESDPNDEMPWVYYGHGVTFGTQGTIRLPFAGATMIGTMESIAATWLTVYLTTETVSKAFDDPEEAVKGMSGPVGTVAVMNAIAVEGFALFLQVAGSISIGIAVFNLLPLPALDGGQLILLGIRRIFGNFRAHKYVESALQVAGVLLLIGLGIFITVRDIAALF